MRLLTWQLEGLLVIVKHKLGEDAEPLVVLQQDQPRPFALVACPLLTGMS